MADCCLSSRYVSENLKGRFIPGSSHLPDSEASGRSVPFIVDLRYALNQTFNARHNRRAWATRQRRVDQDRPC